MFMLNLVISNVSLSMTIAATNRDNIRTRLNTSFFILDINAEMCNFCHLVTPH